MYAEREDLTKLVNLWKSGDRAAGDLLFAALQIRLRKAANKLLHQHGGFHKLQATEIVNQAYFRMANERKGECPSRSEFMAIAIRAIDRTILDAMRYDRAGIRDFRVEVQEEEVRAGNFDGAAAYDEETLNLEMDYLDQALQTLRAKNPVAYQVLVRKVFNDETLRVISLELNISEDTAQRKWSFARAFLATSISELRRLPRA